MALAMLATLLVENVRQGDHSRSQLQGPRVRIHREQLAVAMDNDPHSCRALALGKKMEDEMALEKGKRAGLMLTQRLTCRG
jgi:hypothetical protein